MANESHTYNYFDNGSTCELRSKTITVYDSANKVIKSESYNNEEFIYNRYELLSPTVYQETDYGIYGLLASVVTKTTEGTKIGEEKYYTFVNYTTGEKKNQLVSRDEDNVSTSICIIQMEK